jgi:aspartyl-tRNA(Asn)/glutamyl-tRNA(Gln) amidotransferase subunit A
MCAGSSSGSAAAVASGVYPFALGTDTGDSIRKPAAYTGIVGYKPTYGMISRYGVIPYASSLDHCGVLTRTVEDAAIVVDAMKGIDEADMTSWDSKNIELFKNLNKDLNGKKLCYIKELCDNKIKENGASVEEVSVDKLLLNAVSSTYVVISCAEATSNMSNMTGISFGPRGDGDNVFEVMKDHRTKGFSPLIKRRFVIGSYVLQRENQEKYFKNAQRVRRLIVNEWKKLFAKYDAIILPVSTGPAKKLEGSTDLMSKDSNLLDSHLAIGNFGGFPSITIPDGFVSNLPVGINITGNCYDDQNVLNIAYGIESILDYKNMTAKGDNND